MTATVGVVGAGITGLALVHALRDRGVDAVAFEADDRPGGVIRSDRVDGRVLEYGPQRVRLTPALADLVEDVGLSEDVVTADGDRPLYVYARGALREVPRDLGAFVRTDLLPWRSKLRLLGEPLTAAGRPDESAADFFARKFGDGAYRNLIEPLFGGIYGSDPAEMPVRHALSRILALERREGSLLRPAARRLLGDDETPPPATIAGGLDRLPGAVYDRHRDRVRLDAPVERIAADGDGYALETSGDTTRVDRVVVTTPADAAADVLAGLAPDAADGLRRLRYNPLALVHLRADLAREGYGYQVRRDEPLRTLGVTWNDSLFDRDGVYTCFFGGMTDPEALEESDATLGRIAADEFRDVAGATDVDVLDVTRLPRAFPAYDASWDALDDVTLPDGITLATNYTARMGVPSRVREATRLADSLADGATGADEDADAGSRSTRPSRSGEPATD